MPTGWQKAATNVLHLRQTKWYISSLESLTNVTMFSVANEAFTDLWQSLYHGEATVSQRPIHVNT